MDPQADAEDGQDSDSGLDQLESVRKLGLCTWDMRYQAMRFSGVGDIVSIGSFKAECAQLMESVASEARIAHNLASIPPGPVRDFGLTEMLDISLDELKVVQEECNAEKLNPAQEVDSVVKCKESNLPKDSPLKSLRNGKMVKNFLLLGSGPSLNPGVYKDMLPEQKSRRSRVIVRNKELESEVVIVILIFHPVKRRPDQELHVLSSQPLTALRDKIICPCDYFVTHDFSEDLDAFGTTYESNPDPPNPSPSAFFFINNTFYNDLRHPQSDDKRVREIISWAESQRRRRDTSPEPDEPQPEETQLTQADMAMVKFEQLKIRQGYPYLYNHHGNCEHLLVFTDIRLYNPAVDHPVREDYPILVYKHKVKHRLCSVCSYETAQWVTEDDDLAPESPCFFCKDCFKKLHYSSDNKKLCDFKAYPYKASV